MLERVEPRGGARVGRWCREAVVEPLLSVLFPPRCVECGEFETHLCEGCRRTLQAVGADSCPRCGEPGARPLVGGRCSVCMGKELEYAGSRSAFLHEAAAKRLVAEFKFGGQPVLGRLMADLARPAFGAYAQAVAGRDPLLVTWVPAHQKAQRERGYNQAELLARALCRDEPGLACAALVTKKTATAHQKGLGKAGRLSNLRGAFAVEATAAARVCEGAYGAVLVVDDVFTTGATASEMARVITAATDLPTYVFTFSRAVAARTGGHD